MATAPTLAAAPSIQELDAMEPIEEARRLSQFARECGTLPPYLAARRAAALARARKPAQPGKPPRAVTWIAAEVSLSVATVYRLIRQVPAATMGGAL